jgi:hypothetical protein
MSAKTKKLLDYIPFLILVVSTIILLIRVSNSEILLVWQHYTGIIFLLVNAIVFYIRHLFGVLFLGFMLLIGLIGLLSYSPAITTTSFGFGSGEDGSITLLRFQPIFLLWLTIYFIVSGRYFVGIASSKYWQEVRNKER